MTKSFERRRGLLDLADKIETFRRRATQLPAIDPQRISAEQWLDRLRTDPVTLIREEADR